MNSPGPNGKICRFGAFEVDFHAALVRKHGIRIRVQQQPLKVLAALLERPGELVTREELRQQLWPSDTFVDFEQGLNAAVTRLRQALGDSADTPRFIETQARVGYRFIASVERPNEAHSTVDTPVRRSHLPHVGLRTWLLVAAGIVCLGLALALRSPRPQPPLELEQLTRDLGLTTDPAVSADGRLLAYASDRNNEGNLNVWVQQLAPGGSSVQLTRFEQDAHQPSFSPDGSKIVFRAEQDGGGIYVVSTIGGEPVRIAESGRDPRYSPDGKWMAYWSPVGFFQPYASGAVFVMSASGGQPRAIGPEYAGYPIWSPDSKYLLVLKVRPQDEADWWVVPLRGGPPVRTRAFPKLKEHGFSFSPVTSRPIAAAWVGDSVLFVGRQGDTANIWSIRLSPKTWQVEDLLGRVTSGTALDAVPAVASDGRIVFAGLTERIGIWSSRITANAVKQASAVEKITRSTASELSPSVTPDGRYLAYTSVAGKNRDIHLKDLQTDKVVELATSSSPKFHPQVSRDGSRVAYTDRGTSGGIFVVRASGGEAERVWEGQGYAWGWSADNGRLLFNKAFFEPEIWSAQFPSKTASSFLRRDGFALFQAKYSPDDQWLALLVLPRPPARSEVATLVVVPLRDGVPAPDQDWISVLDEKTLLDKPRWSHDGATLHFVSHRDGYRCIWSQRLHPVTKRPLGQPIAIQHFHNTRLSMANVPISQLELEVSKDRLFYNLGEVTGNIWSVRSPLTSDR